MENTIWDRKKWKDFSKKKKFAMGQKIVEFAVDPKWKLKFKL